MSSRTGIAMATLLLLIGALLRTYRLPELPPGLNEDEYTSLRVVESLRAGQIAVFYNQSPGEAPQGLDGLYPMLLAFSTALTGGGTIGFRALSLFVSLTTLALVYTLTRRLCGIQGGLAALALLAVSLWPVLLGRSVSPLTLAPLLAAAIMLGTARALSVPARIGQRLPDTFVFMALGLTAALGLYIHPVHFWLVAGALAFLYWLTRSQGPLTIALILSLSFTLLLMVIVLAPYGLSTLRLFELSGLARLLGDYDLQASPPLQSIIRNLLGVLFVGDSSPLHNLPGRPMVDLFSGLVILAGVLAAWRVRHRPRFALPVIFSLALAPPALLGNDSPDFSSMAVLLPVIAVFFGFGVVTLSLSRGRSAHLIPFVALVILPAFNIIWTSHDLFNVWAAAPATASAWNERIGKLAGHIDRSADEIPTVVCLPTVNQQPAPYLSDAWRTLLLLHDRGKTLRFADCRTGLVLASGGELQQIILPDETILETMHPLLRDWLERGALPQDPSLPPDAVFVLDVSEQLGDMVGSFTTTAHTQLAPEAPGGADSLLPPVTLDGNLTFLGYEPLTVREYQDGEVITSATWWRVDGPLPPDLLFFTHVTPDPATITSQNDLISVLPTSLLPRDILIQVTHVSLPEITPSGDYLVSIGAYRRNDGQRLSILHEGELRGTRLFLSGKTFTVTDEEG